ncbi:diguanylate cyclase domain-containing protein [Microvirga sp. M2]|uniref:diguanylate cyclase domain-containing protein n=1 Tax=Microvirga sp. M2 TaxID=3073270 RepID=UPI0039C06302
MRAIHEPAGVARLSGDEFAIILPDVQSEDDVAVVATAIQGRMQQPLRLSTGAQESRTSIGGHLGCARGKRGRAFEASRPRAL